MIFLYESTVLPVDLSTLEYNHLGKMEIVLQQTPDPEWEKSLACPRLMHRIVLLSVLNETPGSSGENTKKIGNNDRVSNQPLRFEQEQTLVEAFAFLASITDDPRKVVAVAIEAEKFQGLSIRLAVNHGGLATVQAGLRELGSIMMRSARGGQYTMLPL